MVIQSLILVILAIQSAPCSPTWKLCSPFYIRRVSGLGQFRTLSLSWLSDFFSQYRTVSGYLANVPLRPEVAVRPQISNIRFPELLSYVISLGS